MTPWSLHPVRHKICTPHPAGAHDFIRTSFSLPQIPSSAVEMPGSTDVSGLNVQFGALDFGSEAGAGTVDMGQTETAREAAPPSAPMSVPTQQSQSSLFSKPGPVR